MPPSLHAGGPYMGGVCFAMKRNWTPLGTEEAPKFWMLSRDGRKGPKKRHTSLTDAVNEAHRLLDAEPGRIVILEAIGAISTPRKAQPAEDSKL